MKVRLEHLTKKYPNRDKKGSDVVAVDDLNFEIPDGKLMGLLGPSGCGKSTTLNLISGLTKPTEGKLYFGDEDVTKLEPEKRGIGLVFQNYALYPHLTVKKNILFPLQNLKGSEKMSKQEMEDKALETARLVQIEDLMNRKPSELSGGQQQRVAIARALVKMPQVLLLDEPLSNLDARLRIQTREEIRRIQKETGITTVFVTHDQEEAMSISDIIVVMSNGVVQQIGKPQDVYDDPDDLFVAKFLGNPPINVFDGMIRGGEVYIGDDDVISLGELESAYRSSSGQKGTEREHMHVSCAEKEREVYVGIRPEGFRMDDDGPLCCDLNSVEVMGRDVTVLSTHPSCPDFTIRSIVGADSKLDLGGGKVRFSLIPGKVYLFDKESEGRII